MQNKPRQLEQIMAEVTERRTVIQKQLKQSKQRRQIADEVVEEMEFYVELLFYHFEGVYRNYSKIAQDVTARMITCTRSQPDDERANEPTQQDVTSNAPLSIIIFHNPHAIRGLMFELYSLIISAKVALDKMRFFLAPVFDTEIPKSITAIFGKKQTNCPIYLALQIESLKSQLRYLIDFRDFLMHYTPFVVSKIGFAVKEDGGLAQDQLKEIDSMIASWLTKNPLRITYALSPVPTVNVFVPDKLFDSNHRHPRFSYECRYNLLSFARDTILLCYLLYEGITHELKPENQGKYYMRSLTKPNNRA